LIPSPLQWFAGSGSIPVQGPNFKPVFLMKLYEIVLKSDFDYEWFKTILVMSCTPLTTESEGINIMANVDKEWGQYVSEVHEKRVLVCARGDEEASDMFEVLHLFGQ